MRSKGVHLSLSKRFLSYSAVKSVLKQTPGTQLTQLTQLRVNLLVFGSATYNPLAVKKMEHFLLIVNFFKQLHKIGRQQYH